MDNTEKSQSKRRAQQFGPPIRASFRGFGGATGKDPVESGTGGTPLILGRTPVL